MEVSGQLNALTREKISLSFDMKSSSIFGFEVLTADAMKSITLLGCDAVYPSRKLLPDYTAQHPKNIVLFA
jgi:hypothetical protein